MSDTGETVAAVTFCLAVLVAVTLLVVPPLAHLAWNVVAWSWGWV